jgi:hypothetical protein
MALAGCSPLGCRHLPATKPLSSSHSLLRPQIARRPFTTLASLGHDRQRHQLLGAGRELPPPRAPQRRGPPQRADAAPLPHAGGTPLTPSLPAAKRTLRKVGNVAELGPEHRPPCVQGGPAL